MTMGDPGAASLIEKTATRGATSGKNIEGLTLTLMHPIGGRLVLQLMRRSYSDSHNG